jgi:lipopolysaccharide export system protein LptA
MRALIFMVVGFLAVVAGTAEAQNSNQRRNAQPGTPLLGFGSNSREPVRIDANRLEVFDKENRAVYSGDVVAVQGQTTVRCTKMTISYAQGQNAEGPRNAGPAAQTSIRKIDCDGPVSLLSGTQSATSDKLVYEAARDVVILTGKVVIADCDNVQRGERAVYDVKTGRATVDSGPSGRVQGVFTPGSENRGGAPGAAVPSKSRECPPRAAPTRPATVPNSAGAPRPLAPARP